MKIGIITQPLRANYGGVLQNWALQQVLIKLGHEPITIDYLPILTIKSYFLFMIKFLILRFVPSRRRKFIRRKYERKPLFKDFIRLHIKKTEVCNQYSMKSIEPYKLDALIVGSDQVWRPIYNDCLYDMFLQFAENFKGIKIAYAASFGVDNWEFSDRQTKICSSLIKQFDAISVRESSGKGLCKNYLGVDAVNVLDPTLLLGKDEYIKLCANVPLVKERFLAAYVLDSSDKVDKIIVEEADKRGLIIRRYSADAKAELTVEEWISIFRDASFVVTDSFHGTVFSILFEKPFRCLTNKNRGNARFIDLLDKYESKKLDALRDKSISFIKTSLEFRMDV